MNKKLTIIIAPNEDGFGTSGWAVRLAKELARQGEERISKIKIVVATHKLENFHKDRYSNLPIDVRVVRLNQGANRIELTKKKDGSVDISSSIRQAVLTYSESRAEYASELMRHGVLESADLVIDFGVPQMVRAVYNENRLRAPGPSRSVIGVTVLDHVWSLSLRKMILGDPISYRLTENIENALTDIRNDEALTQETFLFAEPISQPDYYEYWRGTLGRLPKVIRGCLGGPLSTLEYVKDSEFAQLRSQSEAKDECPPEAYQKARQYAKQILGINNDQPTLFVSGGGTCVWDEVLKKLIDDYESSVPTYNTVVYSPAEVERRGIHLRGQGGVEKGLLGNNEKFIFIGQTVGETHHVLFPAFDLVLTRAGGGTVNDALACGVPLRLVEELGMWQVEQIRQSCLRMRVAEGIELEDFKESPRACVESQKGELNKLEDRRARALALPNHREIWLVRELMKLTKAGST
jgi:hypothetical protein